MGNILLAIAALVLVIWLVLWLALEILSWIPIGLLILIVIIWLIARTGG